MNNFISIVIGATAWITSITTIAYMSIGEMPNCEPFNWTIVPTMFGFTLFTGWLGWKLAKGHSAIQNSKQLEAEK